MHMNDKKQPVYVSLFLLVVFACFVSLVFLDVRVFNRPLGMTICLTIGSIVGIIAWDLAFNRKK